MEGRNCDLRKNGYVLTMRSSTGDDLPKTGSCIYIRWTLSIESSLLVVKGGNSAVQLSQSFCSCFGSSVL